MGHSQIIQHTETSFRLSCSKRSTPSGLKNKNSTSGSVPLLPDQNSSITTPKMDIVDNPSKLLVPLHPSSGLSITRLTIKSDHLHIHSYSHLLIFHSLNHLHYRYLLRY